MLIYTAFPVNKVLMFLYAIYNIFAKQIPAHMVSIFFDILVEWNDCIYKIIIYKWNSVIEIISC